MTTSVSLPVPEAQDRRGPDLEPARSPESAGKFVAELFDAHGSRIYRLCRFLLRSDQEAEDAAQQVFLSSYQSLLSGHSPLDAPAWLSAIARNECRRRAGEMMRTPLPVALDEEIAVAGADDEAFRREDLAAARRALAKLPARQREALLLRELCGHSYDEIAELQGTTVPAVETLLVRARRQVQLDERRTRALFGGVAVPAGLRAGLERTLPGFGSRHSLLRLPVHRVVTTKLVSKPLALKAATVAVGAALAAGSSVVVQDLPRRPAHPRPTPVHTGAGEAKGRSNPVDPTEARPANALLMTSEAPSRHASDSDADAAAGGKSGRPIAAQRTPASSSGDGEGTDTLDEAGGGPATSGDGSTSQGADDDGAPSDPAQGGDSSGENGPNANPAQSSDPSTGDGASGSDAQSGD